MKKARPYIHIYSIPICGAMASPVLGNALGLLELPMRSGTLSSRKVRTRDAPGQRSERSMSERLKQPSSFGTSQARTSTGSTMGARKEFWTFGSGQCPAQRDTASESLQQYDGHGGLRNSRVWRHRQSGRCLCTRKKVCQRPFKGLKAAEPRQAGTSMPMSQCLC